LLQASVAVIVNVRVTRQPLVASAQVTTMTGVPAQLSVALTSAVRLATVGNVAGLQPKARPVAGTPLITGAVVSIVQV
jgi:hypothetical protein